MVDRNTNISIKPIKSSKTYISSQILYLTGSTKLDKICNCITFKEKQLKDKNTEKLKVKIWKKYIIKLNKTG